MAISKTLTLAIEGGAPETYANVGAACAAVVTAAATKNEREAAAADARDALYDDAAYEAQRQAILTDEGEAAELVALAADISAASAYDAEIETLTGNLSAIDGHLSAVGA
jgi:hypothetical protein